MGMGSFVEAKVEAFCHLVPQNGYMGLRLWDQNESAFECQGCLRITR